MEHPHNAPHSSSPPRLVALRGATAIAPDDPADYQEALVDLIATMMAGNGLTPDDLVAVWFTVTPDLVMDNPARIARTSLPGWDTVPMLCGVEPTVAGAPDYCVRVLIQAYMPTNGLTRNFKPPLAFCYLRGCKHLRK